MRQEELIEITIPAGIDEGMKIRSSGRGEPGLEDGRAGDLYIEIKIEEHRIFRRDSDDLHCTAKVPMKVAFLGGEIEIPTLGGKALIQIPQGTQSGKILRLRGKGIKGLTSAYPGDLYCRIEVVGVD
jgi:molecular chaperone DnaJ